MLPAPPRPQEPAGKGGLRPARCCVAASLRLQPRTLRPQEGGACLRPDAPTVGDGSFLPEACTNKCLLLENPYAGLQVSLPSYCPRRHSGTACGPEVKVTLVPFFSSSSPLPQQLALLPSLTSQAPPPSAIPPISASAKLQTQPFPFTAAGCRGELNSLA